MKRVKKWMVGLSIALSAALLMSFTVVADPVNIDLAEVVGAGFNTVVSEIMAILVVILPIGLGLIGMFLAVRKGISLMRSMVSPG